MVMEIKNVRDKLNSYKIKKIKNFTDNARNKRYKLGSFFEGTQY